MSANESDLQQLVGLLAVQRYITRFESEKMKLLN